MEEFDKKDWRIMIVDDTPQNLKLLENMLSKRGYQVFALPNGEMGLKAAQKSPPDLMLLDINMPGMDGYEVCRRMKEDPKLKNLPVVFLSALNEISDKIDAFKVGGVDYITKPFQFEEVNARVQTHLKIHFLQKALEQSNQDLEEKVAERTAQLAQANEHLKSLDNVKSDFLSMICHEMRTPVNGLLGLAAVAFDMCPESDRTNQLKETYNKSRKRMEVLLDDALLLGSLETGDLKNDTNHIPLPELFENASKNQGWNLEIDCSTIEKAAAIPGGDLVTRAMKTLLKLAVCFTKSENTVNGDIFEKDGNIHIKFNLDDLHLSIEEAANFFDITSSIRASSYAEDLGLAPVVAQRIISLLGGDVNLINTYQDVGYLEIVMPLA
ncbi:MAG: response regulator [Sedimentisphaeraceae bacterium JB056]